MKSTMRCFCNGSTWRLHLVASTTGLECLMSGGSAAPTNARVLTGTLWPESNGSDQNWSPVIGAAHSTLRFKTQGAQLTQLRRLEPQQQTPAYMLMYWHRAVQCDQLLADHELQTSKIAGVHTWRDLNVARAHTPLQSGPPGKASL